MGAADRVRNTRLAAAVEHARRLYAASASTAEAIIGHWLSDGRLQHVLVVRRHTSGAKLDAARYDEMIDWFSWVALIRLIEYPPAYGRNEPPAPAWVAGITARLREIVRASAPLA